MCGEHVIVMIVEHVYMIVMYKDFEFIAHSLSISYSDIKSKLFGVLNIFLILYAHKKFVKINNFLQSIVFQLETIFSYKIKASS